MTVLSDAAVARLRAAAVWPEFESDRYQVTEQIGHGGMGTIYAAVDRALGREVAIKVSNGSEGAAVARRLAAEARVLATLEHPSIVPVHDAGRLADGRLFYVMKRVRGRTLTQHLAEHRDLGERLRIFARICEAVAVAHARQILHRDLKPDNVMIGMFGEVMVMDWGVARGVERGDEPGTVLGTHGYMAPEQARGDTFEIDERADVFGLGSMLAALLADQSQVPAPLRSIRDRALAPERTARYPSAAALGEDVARYRAGQRVEAHRETVLERTLRVARVYRMPILLVVSYMVMRALVAWFAGW